MLLLIVVDLVCQQLRQGSPVAELAAVFEVVNQKVDGMLIDKRNHAATKVGRFLQTLPTKIRISG